MTIGNLSSKIRQIPSIDTDVMVALLPMPITNHYIPQKRLDEQRQTNRDVLNKVLRRVLQPLTFKRNHNVESGYYNVLCACLPQPHTKKYVIWGSFSMEWEGDERNEPVPAWSCNPVSTSRKPRSASRIQSHNWVHLGIVRILYVCAI